MSPVVEEGSCGVSRAADGMTLCKELKAARAGRLALVLVCCAVLSQAWSPTGMAVLLYAHSSTALCFIYLLVSKAAPLHIDVRGKVPVCSRNVRVAGSVCFALLHTLTVVGLARRLQRT